MALRKFYLRYQTSSSSCDEYFGTMTNLRYVISHCSIVIGNHPFLVEKFLKAIYPAYLDNPMENETASAKTAI